MRRNQSGFTLLELMIATTIFSVVLLLLSFGMIQIGRTYYSGLNRSQTQAAARNISDTIIQAIQFTDGDITELDLLPSEYTGTKVFCVGSKRFTYDLNKKRDATNVFLLDKTPTGPCVPGNLSAPAGPGRQELLADGMRVLQIRLTKSASTPTLYNLSVKIAKGEDDMLTDGTNDAGSTSFQPKDARCKQQAGSQFCAISELYTKVQRRI